MISAIQQINMLFALPWLLGVDAYYPAFECIERIISHLVIVAISYFTSPEWLGHTTNDDSRAFDHREQ